MESEVTEERTGVIEQVKTLNMPKGKTVWKANLFAMFGTPCTITKLKLD